MWRGSLLVTTFAACVAFSAIAMHLRAGWIVRAMEQYSVPHSWWPWLVAANANGAVGLLVGANRPRCSTRPRSWRRWLSGSALTRRQGGRRSACG